MLTEQEIFDDVARKLHAQGKPSLKKNGGCAYRGEGGTKCAVGHELTDEEYDPLMDNLDDGSVDGLAAAGLLPGRLEPHLYLLCDLQMAHDTASADAFWDDVKSDLYGVAERFELDTSVLGELA